MVQQAVQSGNLDLKFPEKHYVGLKRRKEDAPYTLGFMTPYGEDAAARKRKESVDRWVESRTHLDVEGDPLPGIQLDNVPLSGFNFGKTVKHGYSWNVGDVKWRVHDPRGFMLEITAGNLAMLIQQGCIEHNVIKGECRWGRLGAENVLVPVGSEVYRQALENTERQLKSVSLRDVRVGDRLLLKNGDECVYLGAFYPLEYKHTYYDRSRSISLDAKSRKEHYIRIDGYITHHSSLKIAEILARDSLSESEIAGILAECNVRGDWYTVNKIVSLELYAGEEVDPRTAEWNYGCHWVHSGPEGVGLYTPAEKNTRAGRPERLTMVHAQELSRGVKREIIVPAIQNPKVEGRLSPWSTSYEAKWITYNPAEHKLQVLTARLTDSTGVVIERPF